MEVLKIVSFIDEKNFELNLKIFYIPENINRITQFFNSYRIISDFAK